MSRKQERGFGAVVVSSLLSTCTVCLTLCCQVLRLACWTTVRAGRLVVWASGSKGTEQGTKGHHLEKQSDPVPRAAELQTRTTLVIKVTVAMAVGLTVGVGVVLVAPMGVFVVGCRARDIVITCVVVSLLYRAWIWRFAMASMSFLKTAGSAGVNMSSRGLVWAAGTRLGTRFGVLTAWVVRRKVHEQKSHQEMSGSASCGLVGTGFEDSGSGRSGFVGSGVGGFDFVGSGLGGFGSVGDGLGRSSLEENSLDWGGLAGSGLGGGGLLGCGLGGGGLEWSGLEWDGFVRGGLVGDSLEGGGLGKNSQRLSDLWIQGDNIPQSYTHVGNIPQSYTQGGNIPQSYTQGGNIPQSYTQEGNITKSFNSENYSQGSYRQNQKKVTCLDKSVSTDICGVDLELVVMRSGVVIPTVGKMNNSSTSDDLPLTCETKPTLKYMLDRRLP